MKATLVAPFFGTRKTIVRREILIRQVDKGVHIFVEIAPILMLVLLNTCQNQEKYSHKYEKFLVNSQPLRWTISKQTAQKTHSFRS
jgi:hypothetical protein